MILRITSIHVQLMERKGRHWTARPLGGAPWLQVPCWGEGVFADSCVWNGCGVVGGDKFGILLLRRQMGMLITKR